MVIIKICGKTNAKMLTYLIGSSCYADINYINKNYGGNMKKIIGLLVLLAITSYAYTTTINIPTDYNTIQVGLNAASEGDTVQVSAGNYTENITWPATNSIQLIGSGEENCIIDGNQQASVIRFEEDLGGIIDTTTLISDFTITNGFAQDYPNNRGGGFFIYIFLTRFLSNFRYYV